MQKIFIEVNWAFSVPVTKSVYTNQVTPYYKLDQINKLFEL